MGLPDHLTCLLRNLYAGQEATVRTGDETTDWFQIGKGVRQGCILSPCLFNLHAEYILQNVKMGESQAGSNLKYQQPQMSRWYHCKGKKWRSERVSHSVVSDSWWPIDCSPSGSSVYGILQARILKSVAISFSRGYSWPRDETWVFCIAGRFFTISATKKPLDAQT